jgi:A1 cistron-splicing factor AAR2
MTNIVPASRNVSKADLIIVDAPKGLDFGIDLMNHDIGAKFLGIQGIPPGLHLVYFSTGMGARQAFFIDTKKGDMCIKSWNSATEEIMMVPNLPGNALDNLTNMVLQGQPDVYERLGPYAMDKMEQWERLTSFVDGAVLRRADCAPHVKIVPGDMSPAGERSPYSPGSVKFRPNPQPPVAPEEETHVPRFAPIADVEARLRADLLQGDSLEVSAQLTAMALDKTVVVEALCADYFQGSLKALLGELQLSFVLFLLLHSYPALEHWKLMLSTAVTCEGLFRKDANFACALLRLVHTQLNFAPADFFESELSSENFLRRVLSSLFQSLEGPGYSTNVIEHRQRVLLYVRRKYNFLEEEGGIFEGEALNIVDEDQPMVVILEEEMSRIAPSGAPSVVSEDGDEEWTQHMDKKSVLETVLDAQEQQSGVERQQSAPTTPQWTAHGGGQGQRSPLVSPQASAPTLPLSTGDPRVLEEAQFGWRYPALCSARTVQEDLVMCCARLLDDASADSAAVMEATLFLESEVTRTSLAGS